METITVTVLRGGWWLPGRVLEEGQTLTLDAATAEALARRGIARMEPPAPTPEPAPDVAANADTPAQNTPKPRRKPSAKED